MSSHRSYLKTAKTEGSEIKTRKINLKLNWINRSTTDLQGIPYDIFHLKKIIKILSKTSGLQFFRDRCWNTEVKN